MKRGKVILLLLSLLTFTMSKLNTYHSVFQKYGFFKNSKVARRVLMPEKLLSSLYTQMREEGKSYTVEGVASELGISKFQAEKMLDWLASIERELESEGRYKGIERVTIDGKTIYRWISPDTLNKDMFRDYDYRTNRANIDFSPKRLFYMGLTWASMALENARKLGIVNPVALVARDCRERSPEAVDALIKALQYAGLQVVYVGEKTPNSAASYAWAVRQFKPTLSIFLTASHKTGENVDGAKVSIVKTESGKLSSLTTQEIKKRSWERLVEILQDPQRLGLIQDKPHPLQSEDITQNYLQMAKVVGLVAAGAWRSGKGKTLPELAKDFENADNILEGLNQYEEMLDLNAKPLQGLHIVIEGAHTPSGPLAKEVFRQLGAEVTLLHGDIRELSGQHKADPSIIANLNELLEKMEMEEADLGIAFDLDGDRGAAVIPIPEDNPLIGKKFAILPQDNLIQSLLPFLKTKGYSGKVAVVTDVLSTRGVDECAQRLGFRVEHTDAGYPFVKAKVAELRAEGYAVPIYGERSGHGWLDITGDYEDPIIVNLLFALMGREYMQSNPQSNYPFLDVVKQNTIPYKQSTRFQPLFSDEFLNELANHPRNETGWKPGEGKVPMQIIGLGRHLVIERLKEAFPIGKTFDTPAGKLEVIGFDSYFDPVSGINRYAVIDFGLGGKYAGRFVFRASSNDPTFVCSFETRVWTEDGETPDSDPVNLRYISIGGVVLDYLERAGFAKVAGEGFDYPNKTDAAKVLLDYREMIERGN